MWKIYSDLTDNLIYTVNADTEEEAMQQALETALLTTNLTERETKAHIRLHWHAVKVTQ